MLDTSNVLERLQDWLQSFRRLVGPRSPKKQNLISELRSQLPVECQHLSSILYQSVIGVDKVRFIDLHVRVAKPDQENFKAWCKEFEDKHSIFIYYRITDPDKRTIADRLRPYANEQGILTQNCLEDLFKKLDYIHGSPLPGREALTAPQHSLLDGREDLRSDETITLDSDGTTHFEDAFFCDLQPDGSLTLKIHFIDPTYYLKENGAIVTAAYDAALSLYADTPHTIIDRDIIENELSLNAGQDRPVFTVEAKWDAQKKEWSTRVFRAVINVHRNLKIGSIGEFEDTQDALQFSLIRQAIGSLYSKNQSIATLNVEPFIRVFEEQKGVEFLADCMIFAKSEIAKFMWTNDRPAIWRSNKPFNEIDRDDFLRRLEPKGINAPSTVFESAESSLELFKELQVRNERRLLADLIGFLIGRTVYSTRPHGFKPLGLDHYLEIKCRDASGLFNAFRLNAALSNKTEHLADKKKQTFANNMNQKRAGYDSLLYQARFFEMLIRHLPLVGKEVEGTILYDVEGAHKNGIHGGMELENSEFRYPIVVTSGEEEVPVGSIRTVILDGFDLGSMRFIGRLTESSIV